MTHTDAQIAIILDALGWTDDDTLTAEHHEGTDYLLVDDGSWQPWACHLDDAVAWAEQVGPAPDPDEAQTVSERDDLAYERHERYSSGLCHAVAAISGEEMYRLLGMLARTSARECAVLFDSGCTRYDAEVMSPLTPEHLGPAATDEDVAGTLATLPTLEGVVWVDVTPDDVVVVWDGPWRHLDSVVFAAHEVWCERREDEEIPHGDACRCDWCEDGNGEILAILPE